MCFANNIDIHTLFKYYLWILTQQHQQVGAFHWIPAAVVNMFQPINLFRPGFSFLKQSRQPGYWLGSTHDWNPEKYRWTSKKVRTRSSPKLLVKSWNQQQRLRLCLLVQIRVFSQCAENSEDCEWTAGQPEEKALISQANPKWKRVSLPGSIRIED